MDFDVNLTAGIVAGLAAMVPGSIIYAPNTSTGKIWMKEMGFNKAKMQKGFSPAQAMTMMLLTALLTGVIVSLFVSSLGAATMVDALDIALLLVWLPISVNLSQTFFEQRSWALTGINVLNHVLTFSIIGVVLGLFL